MQDEQPASCTVQTKKVKEKKRKARLLTVLQRSWRPTFRNNYHWQLRSVRCTGRKKERNPVKSPAFQFREQSDFDGEKKEKKKQKKKADIEDKECQPIVEFVLIINQPTYSGVDCLHGLSLMILIFSNITDHRRSLSTSIVYLYR